MYLVVPIQIVSSSEKESEALSELRQRIDIRTRERINENPNIILSFKELLVEKVEYCNFIVNRQNVVIEVFLNRLISVFY